MQRNLTMRERDTVLAALRLWQETRPISRELMYIATCGDEHPPLSDDEIDDLCEELNQ